MKMETGNKEALAPPRGEMAAVRFCPVLACAACYWWPVVMGCDSMDGDVVACFC